jgi:hypothetical protein
MLRLQTRIRLLQWLWSFSRTIAQSDALTASVRDALALDPALVGLTIGPHCCGRHLSLVCRRVGSH